MMKIRAYALTLILMIVASSGCKSIEERGGERRLGAEAIEECRAVMGKKVVNFDYRADHAYVQFIGSALSVAFVNGVLPPMDPEYQHNSSAVILGICKFEIQNEFVLAEIEVQSSKEVLVNSRAINLPRSESLALKAREAVFQRVGDSFDFLRVYTIPKEFR